MSKRIGRPPKDAAVKKSAHLSIRMTTKLRDQLEAERRQPEGERSLSQEIEVRLRQSFEKDKEIEKRFGGPATARLLEIVAERIVAIEISAGGTEEAGGPARTRWFTDRFVYDQVRSMIDTVLDHFKPKGRRTIPKPLRWHPSLRKDVENLGRHNALLALACLESAATFSPESDVPSLYDKAALPLGRRLRGSPIDELQKDRQQTRRRIFEYHGKQPPADAASEEALDRKVDAITTRSIIVYALVSYLKPRLINGAKIPSMAMIFEGITGANLGENKPIIIERIKSATKGKLVKDANIDVDRDVAQILDGISASEISNETISDDQHRTMQRRAARSAANTPKGERK